MLFVFTLLLIEFLDEFVFGAAEAAWPLIRDDLRLSYLQIGLLLTIPDIFGNLIEMPLGILADIWKRRFIVLTGGVMFALACYCTAISGSFFPLLLSTMLFHPASGAFVSMSQATLMDSDPARHDQNMARWTLAGSIGVVAGTLLLGGAVQLGFSWRSVYVIFGTLAVVLVFVASRFKFPNGAAGHQDDEDEDDEPITGFGDGARRALAAMRRPEIWRWIMLLEMADLLADVLLGFLALYLVDVGQLTPAQAGLAVGFKTIIDIVGDAAVIPVLERVDSLTYLRISAMLEIGAFAAFLLVPGFVPKMLLIALVSLLNSGWYAILTGRLYSAMPGQSGTVTTVGNVIGMAGSFIPLAIGVAANEFGIQTAMWLLILGPIALVIGLPRGKGKGNIERIE